VSAAGLQPDRGRARHCRRGRGDTGGSTPLETIQVATAVGAQVLAASAIVDRSGGKATLDVPLHALMQLSLPTYDPDTCPLCAQGLPDRENQALARIAVAHDQ